MTIGQTVDTAGYVTQFAIAETYQTMRYYTDFSSFGQVHGNIFQFRQSTIRLRLWLQNKTSPQSYYGKAIRFITPTSINIKRKFSLHPSKGRLTAYYFTS